MKIMIYAHLFPPSSGGLQYANLEIAKGLRSLGHDLKVIACYNKGINKFISELDFPVHILPKWPFATMSSLSGKGLFNWLWAPWYFAAIYHQIKTFNPEVILVADETANCFWGVWARTIKIPYISYCSAPSLKNLRDAIKNNGAARLNKFKRAIYNQIRVWLQASYENAKLVLAVSSHTKQELIAVAPEIASKIQIVPRSLDEAFFKTPFEYNSIDALKRQLGISKEHFILLSVARLTHEKGIDDVITALGGLNDSTLNNLKYVVVGEGEAEAYLRALTRKLNVRNHVIFSGAVPHLQLVYYYDMCDLFILPSHQESFGRVFAEAAARSKPSLGASEGGMVDIIEDEETGFLIASRDIKKIQEKLIYLRSNLKKLKMLGESARFKAEKNYTSQIVALQLEECLKKAAQTNGVFSQ